MKPPKRNFYDFMADSRVSSSEVPKGIRAVMGGMSGMGATFITHPMDVVKNRMQLVDEGKKTRTKVSAMQIFRNLLKTEGMFAIYVGLSASLLRQATYTTTRIGVYAWLFDLFSGPDGERPDLVTKAAIGMFAGLVGAFAGTPSDIALIRMTADGRLPSHKRRNYRNIFNALHRIRKEEGISTLWRGAVPTMGRAMIVNVAQLVSYSEAKEYLMRRYWYVRYFREDDIPVQVCASLISGLVTTIASMPVDLVKTRLQNMHAYEYKGSLDVLVKVVRNEGFFAFWRGFLPYYAKQAPATLLMFLFLEQLDICYLKYVLGITDRDDTNLDDGTDESHRRKSKKSHIHI